MKQIKYSEFKELILKDIKKIENEKDPDKLYYTLGKKTEDEKTQYKIIAIEYNKQDNTFKIEDEMTNENLKLPEILENFNNLNLEKYIDFAKIKKTFEKEGILYYDSLIFDKIHEDYYDKLKTHRFYDFKLDLLRTIIKIQKEIISSPKNYVYSSMYLSNCCVFSKKNSQPIILQSYNEPFLKQTKENYQLCFKKIKPNITYNLTTNEFEIKTKEENSSYSKTSNKEFFEKIINTIKNLSLKKVKEDFLEKNDLLDKNLKIISYSSFNDNNKPLEAIEEKINVNGEQKKYQIYYINYKDNSFNEAFLEEKEKNEFTIKNNLIASTKKLEQEDFNNLETNSSFTKNLKHILKDFFVNSNENELKCAELQDGKIIESPIFLMDFQIELLEKIKEKNKEKNDRYFTIKMDGFFQKQPNYKNGLFYKSYFPIEIDFYNWKIEKNFAT